MAFEDVWFSYARRRAGRGGAATAEEGWTLRDVSFAVDPGRSVALVGATGAGKTTIISLLMRFYDVQRGRVAVDGRDVREWDVQALRSSLALVLQDVHLFSGTIASNVRLGSDIPMERVRAAAKAVHAHRFIEALPMGYETEVKERGSTLSVGQKQLLSFARALAHDPRVLILDEATSSVDTETEELIQDALRVLLKGRTAIVIAHRLSTVQHVDEILVMHKGRIRERGTHQELLARRGFYWKLYQLQYKEQEAVAGGRRDRGRRRPRREARGRLGRGGRAASRRSAAVAAVRGGRSAPRRERAPADGPLAANSHASVASARTPSGSAASSTSKVAVWFVERMPRASLRVPRRKKKYGAFCP